MKKKAKQLSRIRSASILVAMFLLGSLAGYYYLNFQNPTVTEDTRAVQKQEDKYIAFTSEIYGLIQKNYWKKIDDEQLSNLYRLAAEKVLETPQTLASNNAKGVQEMLSQIVSKLNQEERDNTIIKISDVVLANLQPFGRSRLFAEKEKEKLQNTVNNIDPNVNLYQVLNVEKDASQEEISVAYQKKIKQLSLKSSEKAKQELEQLKRSYATLANPEAKRRYDTSGIEPTVSVELLDPTVAYIQIKRMSPTTVNDFIKASDSMQGENGLDSLILDLRGNIGGAVDILPYLLGPFIGNDQYAYEFLHQDKKTPFKTKIGWLPSLVRYKKVIILIDGKTQSSGEVMAATLKKYNVGVLVGTTTKGWGTIEQLIPIKTKLHSDKIYSALLAHSLTLRDDGQPIEGTGVDPTVSTKDPQWKFQLLSYYNSPLLVDEVEKLLNKMR